MMNEHLPAFQRGNEAQMSSIERLIYHQEWIKKQHKDVKDKILQRNKPKDEGDQPIMGFIKD